MKVFRIAMPLMAVALMGAPMMATAQNSNTTQSAQDWNQPPADSEQAQAYKDGIEAAVVSMPCWELFATQPAGYRAAVLGSAPRVAVEAPVDFGWERWLGEKGTFVGMGGFGASAPAAQLYEHFGITPARIAAAARELVGS